MILNLNLTLAPDPYLTCPRHLILPRLLERKYLEAVDPTTKD